MRALYEIDDEILKCVDLETGEIVDEEKLKSLEMERDQKVEGVILWRKDLLAEATAIENEVKNLTARAKVCKNKAEQLKNYISYALGGEKFKTERCSVSYRATKSIVIDNPADIDQKYYKPINEEWISKTAIKDDIESGKEVKGAHQEERQSMIIK